MRLAIGTAQFGQAYGIANQTGRLQQSEIKNILNLARLSGIDMLDSAIAYGDSEARIGACGIAGFRLITKLPPLPSGTANIAAWVFAHLQGSLNRLQVKTLYGVLCHHASDWYGEGATDLHAAFAQAQAEGLVEKVGISIYDPAILPDVMSHAVPGLIQAPMSILDRRLIDSGWLPRLYDAGTEIHARSVFLQGLLLMERGQIPPRFERWADLWDDWHDSLDRAGVSPLEACLGYALSNPEVARVVVGVDSEGHLAGLIQASKQVPKAFDAIPMRLKDERLLDPSLWSTL
jgi:aryl-alcohol dehydrogenase-like predicted oxidoreductase